MVACGKRTSLLAEECFDEKKFYDIDVRSNDSGFKILRKINNEENR
jgi:hypothetical protein